MLDGQSARHRWSRRTIFWSIVCLLMPVSLAVVHEAFGVLSLAQLVYGETGIICALLFGILLDCRPPWAKLLAAQALIALGILTRLVMPVWFGIPDLTAYQLGCLVFVPGVFVAAVWVASARYGKKDASPGLRFRLAMYLGAFGLQALLLPLLLGESLRAHIAHVAPNDEELIYTNPEGTLVLAHSILTPTTATFYRHRDGRLAALSQFPVEGYPVGVRVLDDHALVATRIENDDDVVERIDFLRVSDAGAKPVGTYPCSPAENPKHTVNNLSPDGRLLALADGSLVSVPTGERVSALPDSINDADQLSFFQWTEPDGRAAYYGEINQQLVLLDTVSGAAEQYTLRGHPASVDSLSVLPGAQRVWYEEQGLFSWQLAFVENLLDRNRSRLSRRQGKAMYGSVWLWTGPERLTYVTALGSLESLRMDTNHKRFSHTRHSQAFEFTAHAAFAGESRWLFWVTPSHTGPGTAIHAAMVSTPAGNG